MKTVVVIDDNSDLLENLKEILELSGYRVFTAEDGKSGLEAILAHKPNLVICDIMMPNLDGIQVAGILNKLPSEKKIPFIYLSAFVDDSGLNDELKENADAFIRKPVIITELLGAIEKRLQFEDYLHT